MITLIKKKIAVRYIQDRTMSPLGLLHLPGTTILRSDQGIVKYVGPDQKEYKPGDYVVFSGWDGSTAHIEGENHGMVILEDEDRIVCKLHPPHTEISGLYHKDENGEYFPATYESSVELLAQQYEDLPRFANLKDRHDPLRGRSIAR